MQKIPKMAPGVTQCYKLASTVVDKASEAKCGAIGQPAGPVFWEWVPSWNQGWRRGVVVSGVRRINEANASRARLVLGWVTVFGRVYHLGMYKTTRSTQPCIPTESLNRAPASVGGKGGNVTSVGWQVTLRDPIRHVSSRSVAVWQVRLRTAISVYFTLMARLWQSKSSDHDPFVHEMSRLMLLLTGQRRCKVSKQMYSK